MACALARVLRREARTDAQREHAAVDAEEVDRAVDEHGLREAIAGDDDGEGRADSSGALLARHHAQLRHGGARKRQRSEEGKHG